MASPLFGPHGLRGCATVGRARRQSPRFVARTGAHGRTVVVRRVVAQVYLRATQSQVIPNFRSLAPRLPSEPHELHTAICAGAAL